MRVCRGCPLHLEDCDNQPRAYAWKTRILVSGTNTPLRRLYLPGGQGLQERACHGVAFWRNRDSVVDERGASTEKAYRRDKLKGGRLMPVGNANGSRDEPGSRCTGN